MNSHTNNMDKIPGTSTGITENNLTFKSKSNELIGIFNIKTKEITEVMQSLHFGTIDLRNKLSKGHITNNHPIIAQITTGSNVTSQGRMDIYPQPSLPGMRYDATYIRK